MIAAMSQGDDVLGPTLYLLYTEDFPLTTETEVEKHADDTAILTFHHVYSIRQIAATYINKSEVVKYLDMHSDKRLTKRKYLVIKRYELQLKLRKLYWLTSRKSELSLQNKLLIYNTVLKPVWRYSIQMWRCAKPRNIDIIQRFQNRALRQITSALPGIYIKCLNTP